MTFVRRAALRLRAVLGRRALEREMQEEMRAHVEHAAERLEARGLPPAEARAAALREFGNVALLQEQGRDARGARWLGDLAADLRFAARHFARQPLTTATIVAVLALGIGANSAIFATLQAFTLRPAPAVPRDEAHVRVWGLAQEARGARWTLRGLSHAELLELAARRDVFAGVAAWKTDGVVLDPDDDRGSRVAGAQFVTPDFFATLGVPLAAGPGFARDAGDTPDLAAVLAFAVAEELYGEPALAVGKRLLVNDVPVRVVGVAPQRFVGPLPSAGGRLVLWIPLSARADIARLSPRWLESPALDVFARLAPQATREQATEVARQTAARLTPDTVSSAGAVRSARVLALRSPPPEGGSSARRNTIFAFLWTIGLLVLLVACTNVSSLMVASAVARRHEIVVRLALGASRARLVRQLLTESALLAVAGGAAGLLLYWWIANILGARFGDLAYDLAPDLGTAAFTTAFALGTGILFGLSPALHATRAGVGAALRDSGAGGTRRSRLQHAFVVAQIVFSQPLLVMIAAIMAAALADYREFPAAVRERVISIRFQPLAGTGGAAQQPEMVDSLAARIAARRDVAGVVPGAQSFAVRNITLPAASGARTSDPLRVSLTGVAPGWLATLGIPVALGRDVSLADTAGAEQHVVIDSDVARRLWGDANPVGRTLVSLDWREGARDSTTLVVVGVIDARRPTTFGEGTRLYTAHGRQWERETLLVRTRGPARASVPTLRELIRDEAPGLPVTRLETLADFDARERAESVLAASAFGAAGSLALALASLGLYGVVSLAVRQRTREIGIRLAIGGTPARIARMFFTSGVKLGVLGLVLGLPASVAGFQLSLADESMPPDTNPWLLGTAIAVVMLLVASAASWLPARRASDVDPALTLRVE